MAKITTGELYQEWQAINSKLQAMIDNGIDTSELQAIKAKLDNVKINNFPTNYPDADAKTELQTLQTKVEDLTNKLDSVIKDGSLNTQLTGSNVEETLFDSLAITDKNTYYSNQIDGEYSRYSFKVINTLDANIDLSIRPLQGHFFYNPDGIRMDDTFTISGNLKPYHHIIIDGSELEPLKYNINNFVVSVTTKTTPTIGFVSIFINKNI